MSGVLVLHDLGEADGGAGWRAAAPDGWAVLDQPGHGRLPPPASGVYDPMGVAVLARWRIGPLTPDGWTVVGVGENAHAAVILAVAGGCERLVLVDGLWGPWPTPEGSVVASHARMRAIAADPAARGPAPAGAVDPKAHHGYGINAAPTMARLLWAGIAGPTLVIETTASPTPPGERAERLSWFGGPATLVEGVAPGQATVTAVVQDWLPA